VRGVQSLFKGGDAAGIFRSGTLPEHDARRPALDGPPLTAAAGAGCACGMTGSCASGTGAGHAAAGGNRPGGRTRHHAVSEGFA